MPAIHETAYPRLKQNLSAHDIERLYTPTDQEVASLRKRRFGTPLLLNAMVYLKCFQLLGYFPKHYEIPVAAIKHISKRLGQRSSANRLRTAVPSRSAQRLKTAVREYCDVKKFEQQHVDWLYRFASDMALTKNNSIDIINAMLEFLVKSSFELPAFSTLERIANKARTSVLNEVYTLTKAALSKQAIAKLDQLLAEKNHQGYTPWYDVKREPAKPTVSTLKEFLKHTQWLQSLKTVVGPLQDLPEERRYQLLAEAQAYSADKMKALKPAKRYALMALLIHEKAYIANDCIADMLIKKMRALHNGARRALEIFQRQVVPESTELITLLRDVAAVYANHSESEDISSQVRVLFDHNASDVEERCNRLVSYGADNYLQFIDAKYNAPLRNALLQCFVVLDILDTAQDPDFMACVSAVAKYRDSKIRTLCVSAIAPEQSDSPVGWISSRWYKVLFVDTSPNITNRTVKWRIFELCVLTEVSKRLRSGDVHIRAWFKLGYHFTPTRLIK